MSSLNVDLNYFDNVKTMRLVARLGPGADVLPIKLWAYVGKHHPSVGWVAMLEAELEHILGWWGEKGALASALAEIGFVTYEGGKWFIHDWLEHSGHLSAFKKRAVKAAKARWGVKRKRSNASSIAKGEGKQYPSSAVHNIAVHSSSNTPTPVPELPPNAFETVWKRYPNKDGRRAAERHFNATVKTMKDFLDIQNALDHYLKTRAVRKGFVKNGSTWFNQWSDFVNYKEIEEEPKVEPARPGSGYIGHEGNPDAYADLAEKQPTQQEFEERMRRINAGKPETT